MKKVFILSLLALSLVVQLVYADQGHYTHPQEKLYIQQQGGGQHQLRSFQAVGIVRKIDPHNGIIIIFHDPVAALKWPSMTMPFAVNNRALFERFKVGEKVEFEFVRDAKSDVIIGIK